MPLTPGEIRMTATSGANRRGYVDVPILNGEGSGFTMEANGRTMMTALAGNPEMAAVARAIAERHAGRPGPLLPVLHDIQAALGHVPGEALRAVAEVLNLSRAEVHGVASFYHDFREEPAGRHVIRICRAEACQASGGDVVAAHAASKLKIGFGETTADGAFTLEAVYCLGLCACAPAAMVDDRLAGRLDTAAIDALIEGCDR